MTMMKIKTLALTLALFALSLPLFAKNVTNGSVNFSIADPNKKIIALSGDWEFYANQTFTSLMGARLRVDFIETPKPWSKKVSDKPPISPIGCHTYRVLITGLRPNYEYAIFSRRSPQYSAIFYANSKFLLECGKFSRHEENYKPAQVPIYERVMSNSNGLIELVVQVSNFTGGDSGITSPIYFGENSAIEKLFIATMLTAATILGGLTFIFFMNYSFWSFNKERKSNFYFAALIFFVAARQLFLNFNGLGALGLALPFGIQFKLENALIFSGALIGAFYTYDAVFSAKHVALDRAISTITLGMLIVFMSLPDKIAVIALKPSLALLALFTLYAMFRLVLAIKTGQTRAAFFLFIFMLVAIPILIDYSVSVFTPGTNVLAFEFAASALMLIDTVFIAASLELLQKKSINLKNDSSKYHLSVRRFIPRNLPKVSDEDIFKKLEVGSSLEGKMTIMAVGFKVISPDSTPISLRDNFESMGFYTATIIDQINKNNGSVISISNKVITALFNSDSLASMETAHEIRDLVQTINARRAEDYYPCISFTIAIHQTDMLLGIMGDRSRIDFALISSGTEVTNKMLSLGFAMNIPVLISEPTVQAMNYTDSNKLKLLGKIHFSEFTRPIGLYGFISSEEEENSLEILDETPFITQFSADKYINF